MPPLRIKKQKPNAQRLYFCQTSLMAIHERPTILMNVCGATYEITRDIFKLCPKARMTGTPKKYKRDASLNE